MSADHYLRAAKVISRAYLPRMAMTAANTPVVSRTVPPGRRHRRGRLDTTLSRPLGLSRSQVRVLPGARWSELEGLRTFLLHGDARGVADGRASCAWLPGQGRRARRGRRSSSSAALTGMSMGRPGTPYMTTTNRVGVRQVVAVLVVDHVAAWFPERLEDHLALRPRSRKLDRCAGGAGCLRCPGAG